MFLQSRCPSHHQIHSIQNEENKNFFPSQAVVSEVRLPLMNLEQLLKVVRPSGILSPERLLDAIEEKTTSKTLLYRGALCT